MRRISLTSSGLELPQYLPETDLRGVIGLGPPFSLKHDQPVWLHRAGQVVRAHQANAAAISAATFGDFDRDLPHVFQTAGMRSVRALAGRVPLAPVDAALCRL